VGLPGSRGHRSPFLLARTDDAKARALHDARFILIGCSRAQRLLYVVHAEVFLDATRIISARKATRHEKAHQEDD
jgi:uncharacterized DUF497 family protein